ncbi:hypothetical protein LCI18_003729 [Fusarium solani-melongenae]|uniref:Uncharacterized protein n=1 Tax=Fusarium solani subsp. cucurbitae TaxID=2747967 RepID=A0ACD3YUY1_FUSSC|nr:hypothetical protein LCI18_003729 [Fusarium solani-melongenae]
MLPTLISAKSWCQLRNIIWKDPSALYHLDVRCVACKQHMTVDTDDRPMQESHDIHILPCGHMVGFCCLKGRFRHGQYSCPSCQDHLKHLRCGHPCYGMPMPFNPDEFNQIPPTAPDCGGALAAKCTKCAVKAFTSGLTEIYNCLDVGPRPLPNRQFYAFSATLNGRSYLVLPKGTVHLRSLPIPVTMGEILKIAKEQFLDQWKGVWRTWNVGEFEVRFDLYENTEYDSTTSKIKRSAKKLQRILGRKF